MPRPTLFFVHPDAVRPPPKSTTPRFTPAQEKNLRVLQALLDERATGRSGEDPECWRAYHERQAQSRRAASRSSRVVTAREVHAHRPKGLR